MTRSYRSQSILLIENEHCSLFIGTSRVLMSFRWVGHCHHYRQPADKCRKIKQKKWREKYTLTGWFMFVSREIMRRMVLVRRRGAMPSPAPSSSTSWAKQPVRHYFSGVNDVALRSMPCHFPFWYTAVAGAWLLATFPSIVINIMCRRYYG